MNAGRELDLFRSVNRAVGGSYIAVQLLSSSVAKRTIRDRRMTVQQPIGYRTVASEQRGHRIKKTLEIDPFQAETVRLIFRLAWEGDGASGGMGVKSITKHLNAAGIRTRDGGRWGIDAVHKVLTRTTMSAGTAST
jgi:hypothetical protein